MTVEAFDIEPDVRWRILNKANEVSERGAFVAVAKGTSGSVGNADIASAMAVATGQPADGIAEAAIKVPLQPP